MLIPFILNLLSQTLSQVWTTLQHNWPYLVISALIATWLKLYVNTEQVGAFLQKYQRSGVLAATIAAVATPLCSCGTTAVILGMMASMMPWAPIVAFMVSSPLTSPQELFYSAGIFGWPFAITFFVASIALGLAGGAIASILDRRGWLKDQIRFRAVEEPDSQETSEKAACACAPSALPGMQPAPIFIPLAMVAAQPCCTSEPLNIVSTAPVARTQATAPASCACASPAVVKEQAPQPDGIAFFKEMIRTGGHLLVMFLGFAFVGYFLNGLIPASWVTVLFGSGRIYSVPLAATLGLPFYINTEASLPLVRALMEAGMSQGAAMAFMISGSGTSIGAIAGALTIARWRVVGLVVATLWAGAILFGVAYDLLLVFVH